MKLSNMFNRSSKDETADLEKNRKSTGGKFFKIINTLSILGIFVALALIIFAMFGLLKFSAATFGVIGTIACICIGCWLMLPWVACFEQNKHKKTSIAFICLNIVVPLLWIVAIWFLVGKVMAGTVGAGTLTFIKVVFLISLQFSVVSFISNTILRYGKRLIVVQIVGYISYLYFDFYLSFALFGIKFTDADGIVFSGALEILGNKILLSLFFLSLLYVIVSSAVFSNRSGRRYYGKRRDIADVLIDMLPDGRSETEQDSPVQKNETPEQQLQKLQNLLDKKLITQEEFEEKRRAIIDKL